MPTHDDKAPVTGGNITGDARKGYIRSINGIPLPKPITAPQALLSVTVIATTLGVGIWLCR